MMDYFNLSLQDDFYKLVNPSDTPLADHRFRGMRVPQGVRNLILEIKDPITIPAHMESIKLHFPGKDSLEGVRPVPAEQISRWRLISTEDLTLSYHDSPTATRENPYPSQAVYWKGNFQVSYHYENRIGGGSGISISEFPARLMWLITPQHDKIDMIWYLYVEDKNLLPGIHGGATVPLLWNTGMPDNPTDPDETSIRTSHGSFSGQFL
jgi:hypothetical protein